MFDESESVVVLVKKNRPTWMAGKWNAVGGKIEPGETPDLAMYREFCEEANVQHVGWERFAELYGKDFRVYFYKTVVDYTVLSGIKSMTDEAVWCWGVKDLPEVIPNVHWLLPMALSKRVDGVITPYHIHE